MSKKIKGIDSIEVSYGETVQGCDGIFRKYGVSFEVKVENASIKEANEIYLKIQDNLVSLIEQVREGDE